MTYLISHGHDTGPVQWWYCQRCNWSGRLDASKGEHHACGKAKP